MVKEINQKRLNRKNKIIEEDINISNLFDYDPNQRHCEICNIQIHRASMSKHLKSKKHMNKLSNKNEDQKDIVDQPSSSKTKNIKNNPKSLKELARDKIKLELYKLQRIK